MTKHVGAFIASNGLKYILVRTTMTSKIGNVTVFHVRGNELDKITKSSDKRWPELFFGFEPCHCELDSADIPRAVREAVGLPLKGTVKINSHTETSGEMGSMYNHMGRDVMMHGGHHADASGEMGSMYNRMDSKFSGSSNPAAGFSRGAAGFTDMA